MSEFLPGEQPSTANAHIASEPKYADQLTTPELFCEIIDDASLGGKEYSLHTDGSMYRSVSWELSDGSYAHAIRMFSRRSFFLLGSDVFVMQAFGESTTHVYRFGADAYMEKTTKNDNLGIEERTRTTITDPTLVDALRGGYQKTANGTIAEQKQNRINQEAKYLLGTIDFDGHLSE
jgi:hypothetical protein